MNAFALTIALVLVAVLFLAPAVLIWFDHTEAPHVPGDVQDRIDEAVWPQHEGWDPQ